MMGVDGRGAGFGDAVVPSIRTASGLEFPASLSLQMPVVPQQAPSPRAARRILTSAQHSELEMARRRAQKAAEGKRANAVAARRAKRKALESAVEPEAAPEPVQGAEDYFPSGDEEIAEAGGSASVDDEKEAKRLKRLLRNRVSAQQARERKKSYLSSLEDKNKEQEQAIAQLQQQVRTLERENQMLRTVMKSMKGPS